MEVWVSKNPSKEINTGIGTLFKSPVIPEEARNDLQQFSYEIRSLLLKQFGVDFEFIWRFRYHTLELVYLKMEMPDEDLSGWLDEKWVNAYFDALSLPNTSVTPIILPESDEEYMTERMLITRDWMVDYRMCDPTRRDPYTFQKHREFIVRYNRLAPEIAMAFKNERLAKRLSGGVVTKEDHTFTHAIELGKFVLNQLSPAYNQKREQAIQLLFDFVKRNKNRCRSLSQTNINTYEMDDLDFHQSGERFGIEATDALPF